VVGIDPVCGLRLEATIKGIHLHGRVIAVTAERGATAGVDR